MATAWTPVVGGTLLIPSGPAGDHLFVLIYGPNSFEGRGRSLDFVSVSFTSLVNGVPHDPACVVQVGEHPFVTHDSYVSYRHSRIDSEQELARNVSSGLFIPKVDVSQSLLRRIRVGLHNSRLVPRYIKVLTANRPI